MGITFSKQRHDGLGEGKRRTPSASPPSRLEAPVRAPVRRLGREGATSNGRCVAVGSPAPAPGRRMSDGDLAAGRIRPLPRWRVLSVPDSRGRVSPPITPSGEPTSQPQPSLQWLADEESPLNLLEFKRGAQVARPHVINIERPVTVELAEQGRAAAIRQEDRLALLQKVALRVESKSADSLQPGAAAREQDPASPEDRVDFSRLCATQAAQWVRDQIDGASPDAIEPATLQCLAGELIAHRRVFTHEQLRAMGEAMGQAMRIDALGAVAASDRFAPLKRLLQPLCALQVPSLGMDQLGALLGGVRSAFAIPDRLADQCFQQAINDALLQGVPLGLGVGMACGLYQGHRERTARPLQPVRLDPLEWPHPHERLAEVLDWGRRLVVDVHSVYARDSRVPEDRRFEWMMAALAIPGVMHSQVTPLDRGRSARAALEAMTPEQREALAVLRRATPTPPAGAHRESKSRADSISGVKPSR